MKKFLEETKDFTKHFVATGFVVNEDHSKILMVFHKKLQKWAAPGGHIESTETPEDAVIREIFEETGVKANFTDSPSNFLESTSETEAQIRTPYAVLYELMPKTIKEGKSHIHVDFIYVLEASENSLLNGQEDEVDGVKWFTKSEILELDTFDAIKNFAKRFFD